MSKAILKEYISCLLTEVVKHLPKYVNNNIEGSNTYEKIKDRVIQLSIEGFGNKFIFQKILEEFSDNPIFIPEKFNIRSVNRITAKYKNKNKKK